MITDERFEKLAVLFIMKKKESEGVILCPATVKRSIHNEARNLGIETVEMAEVTKIVYQHIFTKTMEELDSIIESSEKGS